MYEKLGRMMGRSYEETVQVSFRFFLQRKKCARFTVQGQAFPASKVADPTENGRTRTCYKKTFDKFQLLGR
jgi:hypothetical protein